MAFPRRRSRSSERDLRGAVVVITGASSGIGRHAALAFAGEGARLVLASRGEAPLRAVADECGSMGAEAIAVPTDVRDEAAVEALATRAVERFGRIDVWVNNAGVIAFGRFTDVPSDVFRQVIETNLMGQVHGARAVVPHFLGQGSGVLINTCSVWGRVSSPMVSAYVASKFAVRGFSESLRQELRGVPGVDVAMILPQAVDTPIFDLGANYTGHEVRPIAPVYPADEIARGIVRCARSPRREVTYGRAGRALELTHALAPGLYHRFTPDVFVGGSFGHRPAKRSAGNVASPVPQGEAQTGGWRNGRRGELARGMAGASAGLARAVTGRHAA
jgi:NAD(P)-dependent dehydrogenase (short-subunit alcohol dehydrogenase family)